jgi:hypothetical protein
MLDSTKLLYNFLLLRLLLILLDGRDTKLYFLWIRILGIKLLR